MRRKIAVTFALVTACLVALLSLVVYFDNRDTLGALVMRHFSAALSSTAIELEQSLDRVKRDVVGLTGTPPVQGILRARKAGGYDELNRSTDQMWIERFQKIMASLLRSHPDYWQARFIDESGVEIVRVNNLDGKIEIVAPDELQNKAEYAYFTEAIKLPQGRVYVSQLNLNREHGRIDNPRRATLRFATPIFDEQSRPSGVIVINLHATDLINRILHRLQDLGGQSYLVNKEGYFLTHPDTDKTFGFELGHDFGLAQIHPRLLDRLPERESFIEIMDDGESQGIDAHIHGFHKVAYDPQDPLNFWAVVFEMPSSIALESVIKQRNWLLALGLVFALAGSITAFIWSGRLTRPLKKLTLTANHIAGGHYGRRVELAGMHDELFELSVAFNQMVDALVNAEQRLAHILDAAGDAIINVDQDQRILSFNNSASQIFGYKPPEVIGRPLDLLLPESTVAVHRSHFRAYGREEGLTRKMGSGREVAGRRKDGTDFPAEVSISKTFEKDGPVFTAILRDVTERKVAESERAQFVANLTHAITETKRNQAQLEAVFQAMEDGIAVLDMNENVILLNEALARINGFASTDEMKQNLNAFAEIYEFTEPDGSWVPVDRWPASRCLKGETISNWVLRGRRLDTGQEWDFRFSGAPIFDQYGQQILALVVMRDITELTKVEREIRRLNAQLEKRVLDRTTELQAANKELEAFSYSVSHDLRAPLRAIDGFSQALLEDYSDKIDETGQQYLKRVRAGTLRMADLIDDMLQLSRVTRTEIQRQTVNLSALAESVLNELQSAAPDRKVAVRIQTGLEAEVDPKLLRIALVNLLSNAWKFTGGKPNPCIAFARQDGTDEPIFYVEDNGVGFDMTYADKLFGAFQRLHSESEFPGTGIGLAIVQRIIHRHGGRVWAESTVDQGTTFYFTLPENHPS